MVQPYTYPTENDDRNDAPVPATDFGSLMASLPSEPSGLPELRPHARTDYASLTNGDAQAPRMEMPNTLADHFINFITPLLIFLLATSVVMFLLNVRFIYTAVHDFNLRVFAVSFLVGVVALNRLIAKQGSQTAFLYGAVLALAVALYTIATTEVYGVGALTRNFMNSNTWLALLFNMATVVFLWWLVNRLTHECCVDENSVAGDIGMFTATGEQLRSMLHRAAVAPPPAPSPKPIAEVNEPWYELSAYDPLAVRGKNEAPAPRPKTDFSARLPRRHPGMALFYFSIPVMLIFSQGLRIIQHLGMPAVRMGAYYMYVYTACVLILLAITCLRQLRAYFRLRYVPMPSLLPWFWLATSGAMIVLIMWGAAQLPMPALPPIAYVDYHEVDVYSPNRAQIQLMEVTPRSMSLLQEWRFFERLDRAAKAMTVVLLLYAGIKVLQWLVELLLANRHRLPGFVNRIITALAWLLFKMWPSLLRWVFPKKRLRIRPHVALSVRYNNPLGRPNMPPMPVREHIAYAYEALRALAADVGLTPRPSLTPYEFLEDYPDRLKNMRKEAEEVVRLYVIAAYSTFEPDQFMEDRLRKFWMAYRVTRDYYVW